MLEEAVLIGASVDATTVVEEEQGPYFPAGAVTALMLATKLHRTELVRSLLRHGCDVSGDALCVAAHVGGAGADSAIVAIAEAGADVNAPATDGATPTYIAAEFGHDSTIRTLAELGADIRIQDIHGYGPLRMASFCGEHKAVKTLILLGAPITINDLIQDGHPETSSAIELRAELVTWATDALVQHRTFFNNALFGMMNGRDKSNRPVLLTMLSGVDEARELVAQMVGIHPGEELTRLRRVGPAIAAIDWKEHDHR